MSKQGPGAKIWDRERESGWERERENRKENKREGEERRQERERERNHGMKAGFKANKCPNSSHALPRFLHLHSHPLSPFSL